MLLSTSLPLSESMPLSTSQRFLIPPFQRLRFTVLFMVATGLGWFLVGFVLQSLQQPPFTIVWQPQGLLGTFVNGLVAGLIVGATQWIVLRRYVPDWLWMLVTCAGYVMVMTTLQSWSGLIEVSTIAPALSTLPPQATAIVLSMLSIGLAAV
ncbi:hypothetical protein H6F43_13385, partial [Leptolyngbya sp. FACHB-36]